MIFSNSELLDKIDQVEQSVHALKGSHAALVEALEQSPLSGWLASGESLSPAPGSLLRAIDSLEHVDDRPLQSIGFIKIRPEIAPLVLEVNASRRAFDVASLPLRKLQARNLEHLPSAMDLGGRGARAWQNLRPADSLWKPVLCTLGLPNLYVSQVVRTFVEDGLDDEDRPQGMGFCWTYQRSMRSLSIAEARVMLQAVVDEDRANAPLAYRDLQRLAEIERLFGEVQLAQIKGGSHLPSVNISWEDGRRIRRLAPLPVFWSGRELPYAPPLSAEPQPRARRPRSDRKYSGEPTLETVAVYVPAEIAKQLPENF